MLKVRCKFHVVSLIRTYPHLQRAALIFHFVFRLSSRRTKNTFAGWILVGTLPKITFGSRPCVGVRGYVCPAKSELGFNYFADSTRKIWPSANLWQPKACLWIFFYYWPAFSFPSRTVLGWRRPVLYLSISMLVAIKNVEWVNIDGEIEAKKGLFLILYRY